MKIGEREIGTGFPVFVIAEAGINAGDSLELSKQFVNVAKESGCDCVKFQTFLSMKERPFKTISYDETIQLKKYCDEQEIIFMSTPHSLSAIDFLYPLVPAYKIASPHITNEYFVKKIRIKRKPVIASTGSITQQNKKASEYEINTFLNTMGRNHDLALLYCVSEYPCYNFDLEDFKDFLEIYSTYPIGYSSHSKDITYSLLAVENGASIIEQHITLGDDFDCVDKHVSLNPDELSELVEKIRGFEIETLS